MPYTKRPDLFTVNVANATYASFEAVPTTGVLTATIWEQTRRAGITAAAGTRLALCQVSPHWKGAALFTKARSFSMKLVITSSECLEWESFAPAATRGYSRYLSGAFSGSPTVTARYP